MKKFELEEETRRKIKEVALGAAKVTLIGIGFVATFEFGQIMGAYKASAKISDILKIHDKELHETVCTVIDAYCKGE